MPTGHEPPDEMPLGFTRGLVWGLTPWEIVIIESPQETSDCGACFFAAIRSISIQQHMTTMKALRIVSLLMFLLLPLLMFGSDANKTPLIIENLAVEEMEDGTVRHQFSVPSASMGRGISAAVVLPPEYHEEGFADRRYPVLYALHGRAAPFLAYTNMAPLRRRMHKCPFILVVFHADTASWYLDATKEPSSQFTTFFFAELIPAIEATYRTRTDRGGRAVTGFSMGGFGAFHYMLTHPDRFGSVSALSGAFAVTGERGGTPHSGLESLLGDFADHSADYLRHGIQDRLEQYVQSRTSLPALYLHCGTGDYLIDQNRELAQFLVGLNQQRHEVDPGNTITFQYRESPGAHNWLFWRDASSAIADFHCEVFAMEPSRLGYSE